MDAAKYAPPGALASDSMPDGFLTDKNVVAIIPEGEPGYYIPAFIANPDLQQRFRTVYNLEGPDGRGGLVIADPVTMAASCQNKPAAWEVMKWLAGSPEIAAVQLRIRWSPARHRQRRQAHPAAG